MAAAEAAAKATSNTPTASVYDALGDKQMTVAALRKLVSDAAIGRAWACGDLEFGHRKYCVTGPVGRDTSTLVVEEGFEWSGAKGKLHKSFKDILQEELPKVGRYRTYVTEVRVSRDKDLWERVEKIEQARGLETRLAPVDMDPAEGEAAVAIVARLTDQGIAKTTG